MVSQIVPVSLADRSYEVEIGLGCLDELGHRVVSAVGQTARAFLIVDAGLPLATVDVAHASLARTGARVDIATVRPSEETKSVATWARLAEQVAGAGLERGDPIIALGGGIVGDIAGFVAAAYQRGVPFVQCPTTLLAMVDAAVGGKTGVNLALKREEGPPLLLKNMLGAFHQPAVVLADVGLLQTLEPRQFSCGLAECVKHSLLSADFGEPDLLSWMETHAEAILSRKDSTLIELIARNVAVKAAVVTDDEREAAGHGGRALLNLGHTFGHALESLPLEASADGPASLAHGEAVALGLLCAARLAELLEHPVEGLRRRIADLLKRFNLPTHLPNTPDPELVLARIEHDKKTRGGLTRFIVPESAGRCSIVALNDRSVVLRALDSLSAPPAPHA